MLIDKFNWENAIDERNRKEEEWKTFRQSLSEAIDKINELFEFQDDGFDNSGDGYFSKEFIHNGTLYTILNVERISEDKRIVITDM